MKRPMVLMAVWLAALALGFSAIALASAAPGPQRPWLNATLSPDRPAAQDGDHVTRGADRHPVQDGQAADRRVALQRF